MADFENVEGNEGFVEDSGMAKDSMDLLNISHKQCISSSKLNDMEPSFYLTGDSEHFSSDFRVNGVRLGVHTSESSHSEFSGDFKSLCSVGGSDSGRKKRCTDRYDSSESSDSGVAGMLSSIDCSTSSGTSDITDDGPGSPYSSSSPSTFRSPDPSSGSESEDSRTPPPSCWHDGETDVKEGRPPDPWLDKPWKRDEDEKTKDEGVASCKRAAEDGGAFKTVTSKKLKVDAKGCQGKSASLFEQLQNQQQHYQKQCFQKSDKLKWTSKCADALKGQGKITEYFKTQVKPSNCQKNVKKDGKAGGKTDAGCLDKYFFISGNKSKDGSEPKKNGLVSSCLSAKVEECVAPKEVAPEAKEEPARQGPPEELCPILSAPQTIRFPVKQLCAGKAPSEKADSEAVVCKWSECDLEFDCSSKLLDHLHTQHVNTQVDAENFVCLWVGCKVYARTSCSRSWLERHVPSCHGGNKPFRCIVDGCGQRFNSQNTLERHVNSHFNQNVGAGTSSGTKRSLDSTPNKLFRRNGKKLRYRRRPWSARMFDYFDSGIMEGLQHRLVTLTEKQATLTEKQAQGDVTTAGNMVAFHSKILARRSDLDGKAKVLLRWFPEDILPDEWVGVNEACRKRNIPIHNLPASSLTSLQAATFGTRQSKHQRKTKPS